LFYNDKTDNTIETTKFLIHKYDFLQVGFRIDEGWYDVTNNNYFITPRGRGLGGHAVNLVGYDTDGVYVLNQWGTKWGANGYAIMKWDVYLQQLMYGAYVKNAYDS
jgi:C1A family cysteine protease